ncbi:MAG: hypothetical protein EBR82_72070 [Caulobacteraceae bacterium]|nr:hypothetical protein [Caulobacteraceae bacterium]
MSITLEEELNSSFVSPERDFMGDKLAPYTEGSRLLMLQVYDEADSSIFFVWSFIFMHTQLAKNRKETIKLAWNKESFRDKVLTWADDKTEADREIATALVTSIINEANKGQVEAVPTAGSSNQPGNE